MASPQPWAETRATWLPLVLKYQDEQRLRAYFRRIAAEIPAPPRDWQKGAKPCKWKKILEEKDKPSAL